MTDEVKKHFLGRCNQLSSVETLALALIRDPCQSLLTLWAAPLRGFRVSARRCALTSKCPAPASSILPGPKSWAREILPAPVGARQQLPAKRTTLYCPMSLQWLLPLLHRIARPYYWSSGPSVLLCCQGTLSK